MTRPSSLEKTIRRRLEDVSTMPRDYCLSLRLDRNTELKQLEALAKLEGLSVSDFLRMTIRDLYKENIEKKSKKK